MAGNPDLLTVPKITHHGEGTPRITPRIKEDTPGADEAARLIGILQSNRNLLTQNIVLSDYFYNALKDHKVLPAAMISDVQNEEEREEANILLLNHVCRLGSNAFYRFCDVLGLTGHTFLAEIIRSEADYTNPSVKSDQYEEVFKRFPSIQKVLVAGEQRLLNNYIRDKVTEGVIKSQWKSRTAADSKVADDQNKRVNDSIGKDRSLREKDVEIVKLGNLLEEEREAHQRTQRDLADLENRCHDLQVRYNEQLTIMMTSYEASERANREKLDRIGVFDRQIKAMNVQIEKYFGAEEYAAQADAGNVKVSRLEENVTKILDTLAIIEQEQRDLIAKYEEERRKLFEALGLTDTGQDLKTAYLDAQKKINSEVKRLTAEVDLLSMAFELDSLWSLFEAERMRKEAEASGGKKVVTWNKVETNESFLKQAAAKASKDISDFNYAEVLSMVKERLHQVHMEIEKLKRKNLEYERKIGKLEGEMDLIRLRGHVDDQSRIDVVDGEAHELSSNKKSSKTLATKVDKPKPGRSPRKITEGGKPNGGNSNAKLPPIHGSLQRSKPVPDTLSTSIDSGTSESNESRLPAIPESESSTPRKSMKDPNRSHPGLDRQKPKERISPLYKGQPDMGFTESQVKTKMKHAEHDALVKQFQQPELSRLDLKSGLPDMSPMPGMPRRS